MPWKECSVVEERLRFVARLLDGEAMTELCREFGISRKTGYKIFDRYKEHGLEALTDRSRRPVRYANQLPGQVESLIVSLKRNKPHWGARKIRELLLRRLPGHVRLPAKSTIHAVLDRHGLVKRMSKRRSRATGTPLSKACRYAAIHSAPDGSGKGSGRSVNPMRCRSPPFWHTTLGAPTSSISTATTDTSTPSTRVVNGKARFSSIMVQNPPACSSTS
jgi:transposase